MHTVRANSASDLLLFLVYQVWTSYCMPVVAFLSFFTALFGGNYVTQFYSGVDFCSGVFLP